MNFIKTDSEAEAETLRKNGYTELNKQDDMYVFMNDGKTNFSAEQSKDMIHTGNFMI